MIFLPGYSAIKESMQDLIIRALSPLGKCDLIVPCLDIYAISFHKPIPIHYSKDMGVPLTGSLTEPFIISCLPYSLSSNHFVIHVLPPEKWDVDKLVFNAYRHKCIDPIVSRWYASYGSSEEWKKNLRPSDLERVWLKWLSKVVQDVLLCGINSSKKLLIKEYPLVLKGLQKLLTAKFCREKKRRSFFPPEIGMIILAYHAEREILPDLLSFIGGKGSSSKQLTKLILDHSLYNHISSDPSKDLNYCDIFPEIFLHKVVWGQIDESPEELLYLYSYGEFSPSSGKIILSHAYRFGIKVIDFAIDWHNLPNDDLLFIITHAALCNRIEIVKHLLKGRIELCSRLNRETQAICLTGDLECLKLAQKRGMMVDDVCLKYAEKDTEKYNFLLSLLRK